MSTPTRFILIVEPTGDGPPGIVRVRQALKCLLRSFGLRCIDYAASEGPADDGREMPRKFRPRAAGRDSGEFMAVGERSPGNPSEIAL